MRLSLVMALTMLYLVGMVISNVCEQTTLNGATQATLIGGLLTPPISDWTNPVAALGSLITIPMYYIGYIMRIASFDFAIFYGTFSFLRWIFCAIGVGMIVGWITILRGVHSY